MHIFLRFVRIFFAKSKLCNSMHQKHMHQVSVVYHVRRFVLNFCRGFRGYAYHTVTTRKMSNWVIGNYGISFVSYDLNEREPVQLVIFKGISTRVGIN